MKRVLVLTARLADGDISPAEQEELDRMLAGNRAAGRAHIAMLQLDMALRAKVSPRSRVTSTTGAATRVSSSLGTPKEQMARAVLAQIRRSHAGRFRRRAAIVSTGIITLAAAAFLLYVPLLGNVISDRAPHDRFGPHTPDSHHRR